MNIAVQMWLADVAVNT